MWGAQPPPHPGVRGSPPGQALRSKVSGLPDPPNRGLPMLTAFVRAFQTPDLRKKLLITLGLIALFRFGAILPTPGINEHNVTYCAGLATSSGSSTAGTYHIINLLSGNALLRLSVFSLGIMPYITSSIILQLLTVVIPRLETLNQEGQAGQAKITQYTRYLTV